VCGVIRQSSFEWQCRDRRNHCALACVIRITRVRCRTRHSADAGIECRAAMGLWGGGVAFGECRSHVRSGLAPCHIGNEDS